MLLLCHFYSYSIAYFPQVCLLHVPLYSLFIVVCVFPLKPSSFHVGSGYYWCLFLDISSSFPTGRQVWRWSSGTRFSSKGIVLGVWFFVPIAFFLKFFSILSFHCFWWFATALPANFFCSSSFVPRSFPSVSPAFLPNGSTRPPVFLFLFLFWMSFRSSSNHTYVVFSFGFDLFLQVWLLLQS